MIKYIPTENRLLDADSTDNPMDMLRSESPSVSPVSSQKPDIIGYKPMFRPANAPAFNLGKATENKSVSQETPQGGDFDFNSTTNLGMRHTASKYLQKQLGLTKEQAAALIGV